MERTAAIETMIGPSLQAMGYDVVRVRLASGSRTVLQVMAERADGRDMSVEDCVAISRAVSALLDVEDPIAGAYSLEVSSPGIDRPLTRPADFDRFAGREAALETRGPIDGRKRFRGRLIGRDGDRVRIAMAEGETAVPLADIIRARLLLTDELIAKSAKRQTR